MSTDGAVTLEELVLNMDFLYSKILVWSQSRSTVDWEAALFR